MEQGLFVRDQISKGSQNVAEVEVHTGDTLDAISTDLNIDIGRSLQPLGYNDSEITDDSTVREFLIRSFDIAGSSIILLLLLPLLTLIAAIIRASSPGSAIYRQLRVGKDGKLFILYKFRTMIKHAEKIWGFVPATQNDERITPVGKILRRTRLDELPQLFNVLKGEMSLVGPRPENVHRVNKHAPLRGSRLMVKPGITGLAQIRSYYDLKPEHKIRYDCLYIQKRSLLLNIYILLKTVPVIFLKKGW